MPRPRQVFSDIEGRRYSVFILLGLELGCGSESPRTHLSPCVLFRYTKLYIVVCGDSRPIPRIEITQTKGKLTIVHVIILDPISDPRSDLYSQLQTKLQMKL